jgi:predicted TIM-barrel fold metal-dependent hydrolase
MGSRPPVIDADGHVVERESDIRAYLQPPWDRRRTPLRPGDQPWDQGQFATHGYLNPEYEVLPGVRYALGMSPAEQVDAWHAIMEREGIEQAVCFPTFVGGIAKNRERDWQLAVARACNDHFAREYNARSERIHCVGVLPVAYPEEAARELRRGVAELGLVAFAVLTAGLSIGLGDPFYDPLYAEAERLGVPLCFHAARTWAHEVGGDCFSNFSEIHTYAMTAGQLLHFTSVVYQGLPLRFPRLRLAFLEAGATWLPYYLDRMDEHWEKRRDETPLLTCRPSEVVREASIYFSLEAGESQLPQTIDYLGDRHFLYASDIPHWDNEFPASLEHLWEHPALSAETKERLLYRNAQELFALTAPAPAPA